MESDAYGPLPWLGDILLVVLYGYLGWRYLSAWKSRPSFRKEEIRFQEHFVSGASQRNVLTKIAGASHCLRVVVARDFLWATAWFPFWLITTAYNLEYVIPLQTITAVKPARFLGFKSILITYTDKRAHPRTVRLYSRNREQFLHAIGRTRTGAAPA